MSHIFISYKREDEARVGRLVRALEAAKLPIWWDRQVPVGENWRSQIQDALNSAKCVVVVWTHESVGRSAEFVHDEAWQAKRRGVLVPVLLNRVDPPLGFREIQAIDLTRWNGRPSDPFFEDLKAALSAKLDGRAIPPAKGPRTRLKRRISLIAVMLGAAALVFGLNPFSVQEYFCGLPLLQPRVSDACGALRLGRRPTKRERISWESRVRGSCAAVRAHIELFPNGAYRDVAYGILNSRRSIQREVWAPTSHRLVLFEAPGDVPSRDRAAAEGAALTRSQARADRLCKGFAATPIFRFRSATANPEVWHCSPLAKGITCGFEGEAVCELSERRLQDQELCGE